MKKNKPLKKEECVLRPNCGRQCLKAKLLDVKGSACGKDIQKPKGDANFSAEVYRHYGLDIKDMLEKGEEQDWGICEKGEAEGLTGNMAGFGMEQSQRIIIDYDKDYDWVLVRRYAGHTTCPVQEKSAKGTKGRKDKTKLDYERAAKEMVHRISRMINGITGIIENEPECTYEDAVRVLEYVKNNYQKKGSGLLNSVNIKKVAEFGGILH